jgi:GNAT superfamily N-acetyltransferase
MYSYEYFETTFEEIYDLWNEGLWTNRVSKIESRSSLSWDARLWRDMATFLLPNRKREYGSMNPPSGLQGQEGKLIGVNSGFKTKDDIYRSRGLYVSPEHRGVGVSKMLLKLTINSAKQGGCRIIWTMPRKSALPAYESVGFHKIGGWIDEGVEFGPNCIAINELL